MVGTTKTGKRHVVAIIGRPARFDFRLRQSEHILPQIEVRAEEKDLGFPEGLQTGG